MHLGFFYVAGGIVVVGALWIGMNVAIVSSRRRRTVTGDTIPSKHEAQTVTVPSSAQMEEAESAPLRPSGKAAEHRSAASSASRAEQSASRVALKPAYLALHPEFHAEPWRVRLNHLRETKGVLGWVIFRDNKALAADRSYEDAFLSTLRQYYLASLHVRRELGLAWIEEAGVFGSEGGVRIFGGEQGAWIAVFVEPGAHLEAWLHDDWRAPLRLP
ncbi:MAG: hypothetical protein OWS03_04160 [Alicyclobacillaceae bacterium]|nr:hypothetical protein [Alicyclobacillaceae bacterium]